MCNKVISSECQIVRVISVVIFWQDATVGGTGLHAEGSVLFASNREMAAIACHRLKSPVAERVRSDAALNAYQPERWGFLVWWESIHLRLVQISGISSKNFASF